VDVTQRVTAFLDATDGDEEATSSESLPELVRVHRALSTIYAALSANPHRAPAASQLLDELWSEHERLTRRVGEEALARVLRESREAHAETASIDSGARPSLSPHLVDPATLATDQEVQKWAVRYRERPQPLQVSTAIVLHALLDRIGPPPDQLAGEARDLEVDRLEEGTSEDTLREVRLLSNDLQRAYLRLVTARLNALRASFGVDVLTRERAGRLLGIIRDYTREYRPGAVYGLSRDHEPKGGSWEADSNYLWHRLARDDDDAPISRSTPVQGTRRDADADEAEEREVPSPEPDWPLWPFVRDRTVLMMGGTPRESARSRVERAFGMKELVWSSDDPRKAQSAEARIVSGGYDVVLVLLRFMSHATNEKLLRACGARDVPYVPVEHGYGVTSIRRSLERFLAPRAALAEDASKSLPGP
jgi:hypothetical protein